ncbi:MAG: tetratricopeptide repeat protein [Lachnospiraceae bacterium]|nr:tetratricopeptide repeat protein [Lachnospiraceae bacterium]
MICYNCGAALSEKDFCTSCGAEVGMYKKILSLSNRYYNDGLEKARVRDLSGAIVSLKQSIKLNRNNVDAHNLLGLVYYEIGEVVEALGQWTISINVRDTKNIATDYINLIQQNPGRLDGMNLNLHKFNQSLALCYQDSLDYAQIQLKKILLGTPKYLKARQLLALIYIRLEQWDKAKSELDKCIAIDTGNTITLRYIREVDQMLAPEDGFNASRKKEKEKVRVYQSGNETIIQPVNHGENRAISVLLYIAMGILIGIAIALFLILPGKIQEARASSHEELRIVSEQSDAKTATIDELELQISKLQAETERLNEDLKEMAGKDGAVGVSDALMQAATAYVNDPNDIASVAEALELLEVPEGEEETVKSESFKVLYDKLMELDRESLASYYYDLGYSSYRAEEYAEAIPNLRRAYEYDNENGEALFYLGNAYRYNGEEDKAKETYAEVIDNFPDTERASRSETYLAEINNQE